MASDEGADLPSDVKLAHVLSHPVTVSCFTVSLEGSNIFDFDKALLAYFFLALPEPCHRMQSQDFLQYLLLRAVLTKMSTGVAAGLCHSVMDPFLRMSVERNQCDTKVPA